MALLEASKIELLNKSKTSVKGKQRFDRRNKSKVINSVKNFNAIDMNKLFKQGILTVGVNIQGETDTYVVTISFGGFLDNIHKELAHANAELSLRIIIRALNDCFNRDDVYVFCTCPDFKYRYQYWATQNKYNSGEPQPSNGMRIRNPDDKLGSACKHTLLVLNNNSWLIKVASVIMNYINYMKLYYKNLYEKVIYPALYNTDYVPAEQELDSNKDTIDKSNQDAVIRTRFQKGNTQGFRFISKEEAARNQRNTLSDKNNREFIETKEEEIEQ